MHGLMCKRCDDTNQEADLAKVMDRETYGSVKSFCNLGDTLDGDGGADLAATARIREGWSSKCRNWSNISEIHQSTVDSKLLQPDLLIPPRVSPR